MNTKQLAYVCMRGEKMKTSELAYINTQIEEMDFHGTGQYFHMVC